MKKSLVFVLALFFLIPTFVMPQGSTTGAFSGKVLDVDGKLVVGAEILIVHVPTGTKYVTLTRVNGMFNLPSVRVGGPYTLTATAANFKTEKNRLRIQRAYSSRIQLAANMSN